MKTIEDLRSFRINSVPLAWYRKNYPLITPGGYSYTGDDMVDKKAILYEIEALYNSQTLSFYIDLLPLVHSSLISDHPNHAESSAFSRALKLLDVGSRTGVGANLIAQIYKGPWSDFIVNCDVLDLDDGFFDYAKCVCDHVSDFIICDVENIETNSYDYIIASHVLEHVDDYLPFCDHLKRIAKKNVFISCPYNEYDPIEGHNVINDVVLLQIGAQDIEVKKNWFWKNPERPDWSIVTFRLK